MTRVFRFSVPTVGAGFPKEIGSHQNTYSKLSEELNVQQSAFSRIPGPLSSWWFGCWTLLSIQAMVFRLERQYATTMYTRISLVKHEESIFLLSPHSLGSFFEIIKRVRITDTKKLYWNIVNVMIKARLLVLFSSSLSRMLLWKSILSPEAQTTKLPN